MEQIMLARAACFAAILWKMNLILPERKQKRKKEEVFLLPENTNNSEILPGANTLKECGEESYSKRPLKRKRF
jgi:hypothetical protein